MVEYVSREEFERELSRIAELIKRIIKDNQKFADEVVEGFAEIQKGNATLEREVKNTLIQISKSTGKPQGGVV